MAEYEILPSTVEDTESEQENGGDQPEHPPTSNRTLNREEVILTSKKNISFIYVLTFFATIGGFLFGYDTGVVSGALLLIKEEFSLSSLWQELFVSTTIGAAAIFALISGPLNENLGRRLVIVIASVVFTIGAAIMAFAYNKWMLLAGRAVVGAGIGIR